jgi:hypothetical protein
VGLITPNFTQWINGSFVTQKEQPGDIDFVSFIDFDLYERKRAIIEPGMISTKTYNQGLDAYVLKCYKKEVENYEKFTLFHQNNWFQRFTYSREDDNKNIFPKGFIEINFGNGFSNDFKYKYA